MKKLETTRKIIPGSVIRVYRKGFGYTTLVIVDNNEYYLSALSDEEFFNFCRENDTVEAYLWVEAVASYRFTLTVTGKIAPGNRFIFFNHTDKIIRSTERKCLTASVNIPIQFFTFDPAENGRGITSTAIVPHAGSVIRLSDREATIRTDADLSGSKFLKGSIRIRDEMIEVVGRITDTGDEKNTHVILFTGMHDKVRNHILKYVFSIYRE